MTETHQAETRLRAWLKATDSLIQEDDQQNVILHIDSPDTEDDLTSKAFRELNQLYDQAGMEPIHTVSEWIFPGWLYTRGGIEEVFEAYPEQLEAMLDTPGYNWGTYFGRMIEREDPETGDTFNPLKNLIDKMQKANRPGELTYHACYELDVHGNVSDIPLYRPESDRNMRMNLPCLTHLSFKLFNGNVHLTALYRSHDYRFKVPGNLLGLARLQSCVAQEVDASVGNLVVHSSRAFIDRNNPGIREFRDLVNDLLQEPSTHV